MADLTLYADAKWESPWVFHAMVALDELRVPYKLEPLKLPIADDIRTEMRRHAVIGKVPCLVHGEVWLTESSAISEYLAETFNSPEYPRLYPSDREQRARARQVMSWLRTTLMALREDRPTTSVFIRPVNTPLSETGKRDAAELVRVAEQLIAAGKKSICAEWSIADIDFALALMRLISSNDPVPQRLIEYTVAQWSRQSVRKYLAYIPTTH